MLSFSLILRCNTEYLCYSTLLKVWCKYLLDEQMDGQSQFSKAHTPRVAIYKEHEGKDRTTFCHNVKKQTNYFLFTSTSSSLIANIITIWSIPLYYIPSYIQWQLKDSTTKCWYTSVTQCTFHEISLKTGVHLDVGMYKYPVLLNTNGMLNPMIAYVGCYGL